jgi:sugar lactone lactonase YvrE
MDLSRVTIAATADCDLGENPLWDEERNFICWTDISGGKIFRLRLPPSGLETIYQGPPVGGFTLQMNGDLLLFRVNDIALLHLDRAVSLVQPFLDKGALRFNDVSADPEARVALPLLAREVAQHANEGEDAESETHQCRRRVLRVVEDLADPVLSEKSNEAQSHVLWEFMDAVWVTFPEPRVARCSQ